MPHVTDGLMKGFQLFMQPLYLDIALRSNAELTFPIKNTYNSFAYVLKSKGKDSHPPVSVGKLAVFSKGDSVRFFTGGEVMRSILYT